MSKLTVESICSQDSYELAVIELNRASALYYEGKETDYTDEEFDKLIYRMRWLEDNNSVTVNPDSPTQKVNGGTKNDKIKHYVPMLSLRDVFNEDDLKAWVETKSQVWCVEPKIDGLSIEFVYNNGQLIRAVTRGDGYEGEDVSLTSKEIRTIPKTIDWNGLLVVRGEVFMPKSSFELYKREVGPAANARNLAVGLMRRKDNSAGGKYLNAFIFNLQKIQASGTMNDTGYDLSKHSEQIAFLKSLGFKTIDTMVCKSWEEVWMMVESIQSQRDSLSYGIDGAVIKAEEIGYRVQAGDNGSVPKWAVAYKYPAKEATTTVKEIVYQLGKTGKLTPIAILNPVNVDGSTVSRCTLHNLNYMKKLDIRVGSKVKLHKSGDIIPKITKAILTSESQPFSYAEKCPVCGGEIKDEHCINPSCPQKLEVKIHHWVSKQGIDVKGVSSSLVDSLIEKGIVKEIPDFYKLKPADLYLLPKMGTTKIKKILESFKESLMCDFETVLCGLCITGLGSVAAKKIANVCSNWDSLLSLQKHELQGILGNSAGETVYEELQTSYYQDLIPKLKSLYPF